MLEAQFQLLYDKSRKFNYSSIGSLEYSECMDAEILQDTGNMIVLLDKSKEPGRIHWATNDPQSIVQQIKYLDIKKLFINFIPKEFITVFQNAGFSVWAEYVDFFNNELDKTNISFDKYDTIEFLMPEDASVVESVSRLCTEYSRGFSGETKEWFLDWIKENDVIVVRKDSEIVGYCCVSIYGNGTILWVRELAVDPLYHRKGFGRVLLEQAILYGIKQGAKRGFLHADIKNTIAISLYNKYGFYAKSTDGELQMIRDYDRR